MKVYIGKYVGWVGPFQIAEKIFFWVDKYPELHENAQKYEQRWDYRAKEWLGNFLAYGTAKRDINVGPFGKEPPYTWFYTLLSWIHAKRDRIVWIKVDRWDSWNAAHTVSMIALPILKNLHKTKHGAPYVEDEDVPAGLGLRSTEAPPKENEWDVDANHFKRFDWVLDEIIWAHEQVIDDDWQSQYCTGVIDWRSVPSETHPGCSQLVKGPNHTYTTDDEGIRKHQDRIDRGLRLFGKYYQSLWD